MSAPDLIKLHVDKATCRADLRAVERAISRHAGFDVGVTVRRLYKKRTNQQNRTVRGYWMGEIILPHMGCFPKDNDRIYEALKLEFWYEEKVDESTGKVLRIAKETREDDTMEYSKFMEAFRDHMREEWNILLPDPVSAMAMV